MRKVSKISGLLAGTALSLLATVGTASAAPKVTGDIGIYYTSHFVSYGADVWGGGSKFFGRNSTGSIYGDVYIALTDEAQLFGNVWTDINDNVPSAIGGKLQEVDLNLGGSYKFGIVTLGAAYGSWNYAGDAEEIVDISLALDDSGFMPISFAPKVTWHDRVSGNGGQAEGSAIALAFGPSFTLDKECGITLTVPFGVTFFLDDDFQGGTNGSGYAYSYFGGSLGVPLSFIPSDYGTWTVNFDLIGYFTDKDALPFNKKENFLTGTVGLKLAF